MKNRNRKIIQTTKNFPCEKIQNGCTRQQIDVLDQKEKFANNINESGADSVKFTHTGGALTPLTCANNSIVSKKLN